VCLGDRRPLMWAFVCSPVGFVLWHFDPNLLISEFQAQCGGSLVRTRGIKGNALLNRRYYSGAFLKQVKFGEISGMPSAGQVPK